jgi:CTP synthase
LRSIGIQPDIVLCRSDREISKDECRKIALFCNVRESSVIQALDVKTIYEVPLSYHAEGLDNEVLAIFGIKDVPNPQLTRWNTIVKRIKEPEGEVKVAIVGKYTGLLDAYKSLNEALTHGGIANNVRVKTEWLESEIFEEPGHIQALEDVHAILVPGGFGERGTKGKIEAAKFARTRKVPYFGICFGLQMAVIEAARNIAGLEGASSTEFGPCKHILVGLMTEWMRGNQLEKRREGGDLGGTMRLGKYTAVLQPGSKAAQIYGATMIEERHRHRYEVNLEYKDLLEKAGFFFSGTSPDGLLPEICERKDHPWFIGVQYHPELKSRPFEPHPLFASFIAAAVTQSRLV